MNTQKHKNTSLESGLYLPIMEHFYSIQGEGYHSGKPAIFIRIGGCDVGCHWCDVKESWNPSIHPLTAINKIITSIEVFNCKNVVITGGEPLLFNLTPLCSILKKKKYNLFLETSGAYSLSGYFDWICLSPKKTKPALTTFFKQTNELKIVIYNQSDFEFAEKLSSQVNPNCKLFLQPEWSKKNKIIPKIIDYVKINTHWQISLQTHKYMNIP